VGHVNGGQSGAWMPRVRMIRATAGEGITTKVGLGFMESSKKSMQDIKSQFQRATRDLVKIP
ncbi:hypothetical protein P7K49_015354, partial [Saguinus oedipus]